MNHRVTITRDEIGLARDALTEQATTTEQVEAERTFLRIYNKMGEDDVLFANVAKWPKPGSHKCEAFIGPETSTSAISGEPLHEVAVNGPDGDITWGWYTTLDQAEREVDTLNRMFEVIARF